MAALRSAARRLPGLRRAVRALRGREPAAGTVVKLDFPEDRLLVRVSSSRISHSRLHPVAKEPWTVDWLRSRVGPDDVFWDVGANIGGYSLIAAALGAASVVSVEPAAANFAALCENAALNGVSGRIVPLPVVLAAETGLAALEAGEDEPGSTHRLGRRGQPVLSFSLDDLLERFSLPRPTLLKLDVDGAEAAVLAGAERTLADAGLRSVLVEVEAAGADEVVALAAGSGLVVTERFDTRDGVPLKGVWYGVFERG